MDGAVVSGNDTLAEALAVEVLTRFDAAVAPAAPVGLFAISDRDVPVLPRSPLSAGPLLVVDVAFDVSPVSWFADARTAAGHWWTLDEFAPGAAALAVVEMTGTRPESVFVVLSDATEASAGHRVHPVLRPWLRRMLRVPSQVAYPARSPEQVWTLSTAMLLCRLWSALTLVHESTSPFSSTPRALGFVDRHLSAPVPHLWATSSWDEAYRRHVRHVLTGSSPQVPAAASWLSNLRYLAWVDEPLWASQAAAAAPEPGDLAVELTLLVEHASMPESVAARIADAAGSTA